MMYHMGPAKGAVMYLISLGIGYLVCVKGESQKGFLKQLGYWLGSIIIMASILIPLVCNLRCCLGKKMFCPYMQERIHSPRAK